MNIDREIVENLFQNAEKNGYAIPHFNHSDFWDMSAIVEAAQEAGTPIFLACLPKVIEWQLELINSERWQRLLWKKAMCLSFIIWTIVIV